MLTAGQLIPDTATIQNYIAGWAGFARLSFGAFFRNSIFIAVIRVIGVTASCSMIAFGFARIPFKTKNFWFIMILTMCLFIFQKGLVEGISTIGTKGLV